MQARSGARRSLTVPGLLRPHSRAFVLALFAAVGQTLADLLEPWPLKIVIDNVLRSRAPKAWLDRFILAAFGDQKWAVLQFAAFAVMAIAAINAICSYGEKYLTARIGQLVMHDLRQKFYSHIQRLSLAYHDRKRTGDLISRVTSDIDAIQSFISSGLLGALINILTLAGMVAVMFYINWRFTLIALSVAPVLFIVVYRYTRRIKRASREVRKKESELVSVIQEVLSAIRVVKGFAREDYEQRRLAERSRESVEIALRARSLKAALSPVVDIIVAAGTCLLLWWGTRMVLSDTLSTGLLVMFIVYLKKMYKPMQDLSKTADAYSKAEVGFERIREVLETENDVRDLPGARNAPPFQGDVAFDHVSFGYASDSPVLKDVTFRVESGQVAAVVGPTGAGKTTLVSLIPRFYDPTAGSVRIGGRDIREFRLDSLRRQISFVFQETILFRASIWDNIAYGKPNASRRDILRASEAANAHEFIKDMPEGYDTMVGERGVTLSGGQRQRIAIARAIIRDTPILILDEASSGLDAASEKLVFEALDRLMKGKTSLVIAHRLSTVRNADVIFVVQDGRIVERDRHEGLVKLGGLYAQLHQLQFQRQ
jgi:ATP-binding cassette subfamily B protein